MPSVQFVLEADEAKAVNAFLKVLEAQRKTEDGLKNMTKQSAGFADSLGGAIGPAKEMLGLFGIGVGIHAGVSAITELIKSWDSALTKASQRMEGLSKSMTTFELLQPAHLAVQRRNEILEMAAGYGLGKDEEAQRQALFVAQSAQSITGSYAAGKTLAGQIYRGSKAGMDPQELMGFVSAIHSKKLPDYLGVYLPFRAGQKGHLRPEDLVAMSKDVAFWNDPFLMAAAAAKAADALGDSARGTTALKAWGAVLDRVTDKDLNKSWKRIGIDPETASQDQKMEALARAGITDSKKLQKFGFTDMRQLTAAIPLLMNWDEVKQTAETFKREASPDYIGGKLEELYRYDPALRSIHAKEISQSEMGARAVGGELGTRGTFRSEYRQQLLNLAKQQKITRYYDFPSDEAELQPGYIDWSDSQRWLEMRMLGRPGVAEARGHYARELFAAYEGGSIPLSGGQRRDITRYLREELEERTGSMRPSPEIRAAETAGRNIWTGKRSEQSSDALIRELIKALEKNTEAHGGGKGGNKAVNSGVHAE